MHLFVEIICIIDLHFYLCYYKYKTYYILQYRHSRVYIRDEQGEPLCQ
jgi:hypothetical protein